MSMDECGIAQASTKRAVLTSNETRPLNCTFFDDQFYVDGGVTQDEYNVPVGTRSPNNGTSSADAYDTLVNQVWPILTVVMPPANVSRGFSNHYITEAYAQMTCIRAKDIKQGSRIPPPLPELGPVHFPRSASWYGVRTGVPTAIVILALIAYCIWRARRKNAAWRRAQAVTKSPSDENSTPSSTVQKDGAEVYQLASQQRPVQLQASRKVEMDAGRVLRYAKGGNGSPQEMDAENLSASAKVGTRRMPT